MSSKKNNLRFNSVFARTVSDTHNMKCFIPVTCQSCSKYLKSLTIWDFWVNPNNTHRVALTLYYLTLCLVGKYEPKLQPKDKITEWYNKSSWFRLTLTVFPKCRPQIGFIILETESTALWAAILIMRKKPSRASASFSCVLYIRSY